jgi:DNA-binding transcriptional LysR family regulator
MVCANLATQSMGISYAPIRLFDDALASGKVQVLLPDWPAPPLPIDLVSPPQGQQFAKVLSFVRHLAGGQAGE